MQSYSTPRAYTVRRSPRDDFLPLGHIGSTYLHVLLNPTSRLVYLARAPRRAPPHLVRGTRPSPTSGSELLQHRLSDVKSESFAAMPALPISGHSRLAARQTSCLVGRAVANRDLHLHCADGAECAYRRLWHSYQVYSALASTSGANTCAVNWADMSRARPDDAAVSSRVVCVLTMSSIFHLCREPEAAGGREARRSRRVAAVGFCSGLRRVKAVGGGERRQEGVACSALSWSQFAHIARVSVLYHPWRLRASTVRQAGWTHHDGFSLSAGVLTSAPGTSLKYLCRHTSSASEDRPRHLLPSSPRLPRPPSQFDLSRLISAQTGRRAEVSPAGLARSGRWREVNLRKWTRGWGREWNAPSPAIPSCARRRAATTPSLPPPPPPSTSPTAATCNPRPDCLNRSHLLSSLAWSARWTIDTPDEGSERSRCVRVILPCSPPRHFPNTAPET